MYQNKSALIPKTPNIKNSLSPEIKNSLKFLTRNLNDFVKKEEWGMNGIVRTGAIMKKFRLRILKSIKSNDMGDCARRLNHLKPGQQKKFTLTPEIQNNIKSLTEGLNDLVGKMGWRQLHVDENEKPTKKLIFIIRQHMKHAENRDTLMEKKNDNLRSSFGDNILFPDGISQEDPDEMKLDEDALNAELVNTYDKRPQRPGLKPWNLKRESEAQMEEKQDENELHFACKELEPTTTEQSSEKKQRTEVDEIGEDDFVCKLCDKEFNSKAQMKQHFSGKSHQKKLRAQNGGDNVTTGAVLLQDGIQTEVPNDIKMQENSLKSQLVDTREKKQQSFKCEICGICDLSQDVYEKHMNGKLHGGDFDCTLCDMNFESRHRLAAHLQGVYHTMKAFNNFSKP